MTMTIQHMVSAVIMHMTYSHLALIGFTWPSAEYPLAPQTVMAHLDLATMQ